MTGCCKKPICPQPAAHRRRVRTTNSLERLIEEARRRTKVISTIPDERAGLSLVHAVLVDVSRRWRGIRITPADLETLNALRAEVVPPFCVISIGDETLAMPLVEAIQYGQRDAAVGTSRPTWHRGRCGSRGVAAG